MPNQGFSRDTCWLRLTLKNTTETTANWLLQVDNSLLSEIDLFVFNGTDALPLDQQRAGLSVPFSERQLAYHAPVFPVTIPAQETRTLLIRANGTYSLQIPLTLVPADQFSERSHAAIMVQGLFIGGMVIMLLYNLFLYISIREPAYLFYVFWTLVITLFQVILHGFAQRYLWPEWLLMNQYGMAIILPLIIFLSSRFTLHFLSLANR
ncbi:MAG: hybrid sensor histidine kinase/response regulator, partial [Gammaproteobacteria bacterium HGW-Gammaproteobacteria-14]